MKLDLNLSIRSITDVLFFCLQSKTLLYPASFNFLEILGVSFFYAAHFLLGKILYSKI